MYTPHANLNTRVSASCTTTLIKPKKIPAPTQNVGRGCATIRVHRHHFSIPVVSSCDSCLPTSLGCAWPCCSLFLPHEQLRMLSHMQQQLGVLRRSWWPLSCLSLLGCWAVVVLVLCSLPSGCPLTWGVVRRSPSLQDVYNFKISWLVKRNTKKEKKNLTGAQTTLFGPRRPVPVFLCFSTLSVVIPFSERCVSSSGAVSWLYTSYKR
jgi:hypothetical protein